MYSWRVTVSNEYLGFVLDQLAGLERVTARRMFGAIGLYCDGVFFAIVSRDTLYFKVEDLNRTQYQSRGMRQFQPFRDKPLLSMSYFEVPADILEDPDQCVEWARTSLLIATKPVKKTALRKLRTRSPNALPIRQR